MGQGEDDKQAVNGNSGTNHKGIEAHIHFLLLEHDLNFPAMGVMRKNIPKTIAVAAVMAISHAELRNVVLNMEKLNIAMNVIIIHVKNINTLMNMTLLSLIDDKNRIWKKHKA